jgi:homogentisate 1,2-dioxygenase
MARTFSTRRGMARIVFGEGCVARLGDEVTALLPAVRRAVVVTTPGRRGDGEALSARLGERSGGVLPLAREHVPVEVVAEARAAVERAGADAVVVFGGGSAIGLGKALALSMPVRVIAVPTTYSGSEMTPMYGLTETVSRSGGSSSKQEKRTGRDERVRPVLVLYDPALTRDLPRAVTMASLWNAMAHAAEALWLPGVDRAALLTAEEALRLLATSARRLAADLGDGAAREDALEGAYLAGAAFGDVGAGLHHKLCHVLGGAFDLPHAKTHAALLPHVVRWMSAAPGAREAMGAIARALGGLDPVAALEQLAVDTGVPRSLADAGFSGSDADTSLVVQAVLAQSPPSVRPLDAPGLSSLLAQASSLPSVTNMTADSPLRAPQTLSHQPGFGSTHESEALEGALPRQQNAPWPAPYGLYPELLNGTPFTVKNAQNSRVWMYRVRATFSHSVYRELASPLFTSELTGVEPNRTRWTPLPIPEATRRVDFLDGLVTLGGDGTSTGPGYLVHLYAANADMSDRAFSSADGDILIVPQSGVLDVRTELGFLRVAPGSILVIPRALKFAVGLPDKAARGWMVEVFGSRLRLPERGPIGSNGLADARHFLAPVASWEDRLCPNGFEIVHKLGGRLFAATQEHSPFDVVAWHGVHAPFSYDLMNFNAMGSVTFDHQDPSIHTVLTAPLDDHGRAIVDFVCFRGRWDALDHSFRPPFMHRNAASEINGVVSVASPGGGYAPGCTFVSPLLTAHGISTASYEHELTQTPEKHEGARRIPDASLWIMFESAMPFRPTAWARQAPTLDKAFLAEFEGMPKRFDPLHRTKP